MEMRGKAKKKKSALIFGQEKSSKIIPSQPAIPISENMSRSQVGFISAYTSLLVNETPEH